MDSADDPTVSENPAYNVTLNLKETQKRWNRPTSIVVMEQAIAPAERSSTQEKTGESSKWDHHITLAIVISILSVIALNLFGVAFGIAAVYFAYRARVSSQNGDYRNKLQNERASSAFVIFCIIIWILTYCLVLFTVYSIVCNPTGERCDTRTHV